MEKPEAVDIPFIFMEWINIRNNRDGNCPDLEKLVKLLGTRGYAPFHINTNRELNPSGNKTIPFQIEIIFYDLEFMKWPLMYDVLWLNKKMASF